MIQYRTIFNIASAIERKGIEFYENLKDGTNDAVIDSIINDERAHIETFNEIFESINKKSDKDMFQNFYMDEGMLIEAYASTRVFGEADLEKMKKTDMFNVAVTMEKDSILFYDQLKEMLEGSRDMEEEREMLNRLKKEEAKHLSKFVELRNRVGDV